MGRTQQDETLWNADTEGKVTLRHSLACAPPPGHRDYEGIRWVEGRTKNQEKGERCKKRRLNILPACARTCAKRVACAAAVAVHWCQNALRCLTAPNCSWAYATQTFHYFGRVKTPEVILVPNFSWAYGALKFYYFGNVKTLKVMLRPTLSWACATLKSDWVAHFVFSVGAAAPKLNTPLA